MISRKLGHDRPIVLHHINAGENHPAKFDLKQSRWTLLDRSADTKDCPFSPFRPRRGVRDLQTPDFHH
jgi:hypothetical protein